MIRSIARSSIAWLLLAIPALALTHISIPPIPAPVRSNYFTIIVNSHSTPVVHAVSSYYFLSFDYDGPATISVRVPILITGIAASKCSPCAKASAQFVAEPRSPPRSPKLRPEV